MKYELHLVEECDVDFVPYNLLVDGEKVLSNVRHSSGIDYVRKHMKEGDTYQEFGFGQPLGVCCYWYMKYAALKAKLSEMDIDWTKLI